MPRFTKLAIKSIRSTFTRTIGLLNPPPVLKVWEWAELRRRMGRNVTAKPGRYQVATTPYQREPQESFMDPEVQTTVLRWGKRLGKTEMINNLHGSVIEQEPRNVLVVYPTLDSAKKWSKQFFEPMRKSTPAIKKLISDRRSKDSNNTILAKEFPGGTISAIGANSPSGFRQVQAPVVTCDEVDAMENGEEGDPVMLAFGRAENYSNSVQVVSSTDTRINRMPAEDDPPGTSTGSRIFDWWLKSDQRKWFVKNPCCGKFHVLEWKNVKWPEGHQHELTWYECPDCGAHWDDVMRVKAVCAGEWRPTAPFKGIRGYWLNGLNTVFPPKKGYKSKLHQFAAEFYDSYTSGESARIVWKNTFLCEPHMEEAEQVKADPFYDRLENYTPDDLPEEICIVGLSVDVQADRLEYEFIGLGENDETWGIETGKIQGDPEHDAVWGTLADYTRRTFRRTDGAEINVAFVAIDIRHKGDRVKKFIKKCGHPRVYPVYGHSGEKPQSLLVIPGKSKLYKITTYSVSTDVAKDTLFARMKIAEPGRAYMHYPNGNGYEKKKDGYFDQLTAEESRITFYRGYRRKHYEKVRERNEALDIRVYFLAGVDILRPAMAVIKSEIKRKLATQKADNEKPLITPASRIPAEKVATPEDKKPRKRFSMRRQFN